MMNILLGLPFALVLVASSASAQDTQPAAPTAASGPEYQPAPTSEPTTTSGRSGFTAMLSIGLGLTTISPDVGGGQTEAGLAGLNLDLGTYINPELAVFVSLGGTNYTVDSAGDDLNFTNAFLGVTAQYWVTPKISVGGGAGLSLLASIDTDGGTDDKGPAITARGSYRFAGSWQGMLVVTPSFYEDATVMSTSFLVAYQWD